jgi:hypothetical protein
MAFIETSHGIPFFTDTGPSYIYYIETLEPMLVRSLIAKPGTNNGLETVKTAAILSRDPFWRKINLTPPQ